MDFTATQIYEDEDFSFTQRISHEVEEESVQVGTLSINSTDYQIKNGITKIGRLKSCDIVINEPSVSKLHAEIEANGGRQSTWICDLNSSNKTKLNNTVLRPTRLYELKDGNVLKFGLVSATYRTYRPADDTIIPETPAPSRQKPASIIIPNTPDSSLNSSGVDDDGSVILGTQKDDENGVFRRPQVPQSPGIGKKNISSSSSMNESKDSQIATALHTSDTNISDNQISIFDAETQKFEEGYKTTSNSIHDLETQRVSTDVFERLVDANVEAGKQLSKLNIRNKTAGRSVTNIHDKETQNYMDDISEMETQRIDIRNVTGEKFTTDIHAMETQVYTGGNDEGDSDAQKSEIGRVRIGRDIHDLETQKFDNEYIVKDISDLETQVELDGIVKCKQGSDISDMETQVTDGTANKINNDRAKKDRDKDGITDTAKDEANYENVTRSPKSRSSSPGSLNLSSPGVEDCPSSPLNQSSHLLESSDLLDFFGEGIDKQAGLQASNMSTPKPLTKVSSKSDSNAHNAVNSEENDDDIFEAPTQRINRNFEALMSDDCEIDGADVLVPKKKRGKPQSEPTNDSDTDAEEYIAELAKKQRESLNKPSNEDLSNRNDPGTSVESEDMFDQPTQRLDDLATRNTLNSSNNQPQKTNEISEAVDNVAATQIISNVDDQTDTLAPDVNDAAPTQLILSREISSKTVINSDDFALKSNQNDTDAVTTAHINAKSVECTTENLDREDLDYELAPTQIIGEIEEKRSSTRKRGFSQVNLNDTVERELNEMFDDVNNDANNIHESPHMSTQILEDILESSQRNDSANKSTAGDRDTSSVPQKQSRRKNHASRNQYSHNLLDIEVSMSNVNKAKTNSQESADSFATITTRRKRNILKDTQDFANPVENTTPRQINSSQASEANNEKAVDDSTVIESQEKKKRKRISKTESKSNAAMEMLNDDNRSKTVANKKSLRSSRSKQKDEAKEMVDQVSGRDPAKVDGAEEITSICIPCPSRYGQRAQTLDALYESDDDILTRLPAVRISGTLSNPPSPSASSTSTVRSTDLRSKQGTAKSKGKKVASPRGKPLRERNVGSSEKNKKPSVDSHSNLLSSTIHKMSDLVDTSDDSDSETKQKRFRQMASRMLNNELSGPKRQNKRKGARVLQDASEEVSMQDIELKNPTRNSSRTTRHSSKQSDESSRDLQKEARVKNAAYEATSAELETKSTIAKRKVPLNVIEENVESVSSKKRKTAEVAEERAVSTRSQRSAMIQNTKSSEDKASKIALEETQQTLNMRTDGNVDPGRSNIKRTRRTICDSQVTTDINDTTANGSKKNKPAQVKETETQTQTQKILRVVLNPIKSPVDDASQEVERIMAGGPSNVQDRNLSIRENNKKKIRRELRTRNSKQSNSDTETNSTLTESDVLSEIEDSGSIQFSNPAPKRKRGRSARNSVPSLPKAQVSKKEIFKKPTRIDQIASSVLDSSTENMISESSQGSMESNASTSSRLSRSKAAGVRRKEKMELNKNTRGSVDYSASLKLNTSIESTSSTLSTPSRTRRSTFILNSSTSSAMRHKILFTGITEDHSKIVKALGGSKVEDPAKCTILVTDKVRRTYKFLCALAKGLPIVAIDWLTDSETAERFLDWENYLLKDPVAEAKFGFRLRKSLDKAKEKRMLDGYTIVLTPNIAPPPIGELKNMVSSCGGKALLRPPTKWSERAVILSREEDLPNARKFLAKAPKTVMIQSIEFILTGILRQETDFDKYKLT